MNKKRPKKLLYEYKGEFMTLAEITPFCNVSLDAFRMRVRAGMDVETALTKKSARVNRSAVPTKCSIDAEINANNKKIKEKRKEVGMFAQCVARARTK